MLVYRISEIKTQLKFLFVGMCREKQECEHFCSELWATHFCGDTDHHKPIAWKIDEQDKEQQSEAITKGSVWAEIDFEFAGD